jgi:hypothetical protein
MPLFEVETKSKTTMIKVYQVEAANEEEAGDKILNGHGTLVDTYDDGDDEGEKVIYCDIAPFQRRPM